MRTRNAILQADVRDTRAETLDILAAAFQSDVAARHLYPATAEYRRHFPGFLEAFGGRAFDSGIVDHEANGLGAAMWFPPGLEPDEAAIIAHLEATMPPERLGAIAAGMEIQGRFHPETPHWYLPWIGVLPEAQGLGVGSALLARGLARADADGLPAYLEATSRRNAALYERHGFEILGVVEAPDYPQIIPMRRPARQRPA